MPKIVNIPPSIFLAPFVRNYTLLDFNTNEAGLIWPCYSGPEMCLLFFQGAFPKNLAINYAPSLDQVLTRIWLKGLFTQFKESWKFKGKYSIFKIQFTPNGFHSLFELPLKEFKDKIVDAQAVFGKEILPYCEQLQQAQTIHEMAALTDEFLKSYVIQRKLSSTKKSVALVCNAIVQSNCAISIEEYAAMAKMSIRNFERNFIKQVGTTPKVFCRLLRFHRAIQTKLINPSKCWTSIALDCDYYDQMHMIRDFKKIAGISPTGLFENKYPSSLRIKNLKRSIAI